MPALLTLSGQEEGVAEIDTSLETDIQARRRATKVRTRAVPRTLPQVPRPPIAGFVAAVPALSQILRLLPRLSASEIQRLLQSLGAGITGTGVGLGVEEALTGGGGAQMGGGRAPKGARFAVIDLMTGMIIKRISARRALILTRRNPIRTRVRVIRQFCPACRSNPCVCG